jgi:hypothetical protein
MKAIIATTVFGVIMMFAGIMVSNKKSIGAIAAVLFAALLGVNIWDLLETGANAPVSLFNNMLRVEHY